MTEDDSHQIQDYVRQMYLMTDGLYYGTRRTYSFLTSEIHLIVMSTDFLLLQV
jgi:hypothetical protein